MSTVEISDGIIDKSINSVKSLTIYSKSTAETIFIKYSMNEIEFDKKAVLNSSYTAPKMLVFFV